MQLLNMRDVSHNARARYYLIANATVGGWMFIGMMVAVLRQFGVGFSWWLSVHTITIGVVATAILVYSYHFAEALTRTASQSYRGRFWRLGLLQLFLVGLIAAQTGIDWGTTATVSALGIIGVLVGHVVVLITKLRASLAGRFVVTVNYYLTAAGHLIVAIAVAIVANYEIGNYGQLIIIHSRLAVWGFAVLTVLGTVVTLLPTVAGYATNLVARNRMRRALVVYCGGLYLAITAVAITQVWVAAIGVATIGVAMILLIQPTLAMVLAGKQKLPTAAYGIIGGSLWLVGLLGLDTYSFSRNHDGRDFMLVILLPLVFGGFLQLITSVLSHLLPVVIGGGSAVAKTQAAIMRTGFARLVLFNLGGLSALLGHNALGLLLAVPASIWTILVIGINVYQQRKTLVKGG